MCLTVYRDFDFIAAENLLGLHMTSVGSSIRVRVRVIELGVGLVGGNLNCFVWVYHWTGVCCTMG